MRVRENHSTDAVEKTMIKVRLEVEKSCKMEEEERMGGVEGGEAGGKVDDIAEEELGGMDERILGDGVEESYELWDKERRCGMGI